MPSKESLLIYSVYIVSDKRGTFIINFILSAQDCSVINTIELHLSDSIANDAVFFQLDT